MKRSVNSVTGNTEITFNAKLISVSPDVVGSTPNGKDYRVATCSYLNANKERVQRSCLIMEGNYAYGMEIGTEYQTKAIIEKGQETPLLVMNHLTATARATFDDFVSESELAEINAADVANKVGA